MKPKIIQITVVNDTYTEYGSEITDQVMYALSNEGKIYSLKWVEGESKWVLYDEGILPESVDE